MYIPFDKPPSSNISVIEKLVLEKKSDDQLEWRLGRRDGMRRNRDKRHAMTPQQRKLVSLFKLYGTHRKLVHIDYHSLYLDFDYHLLAVDARL